MLVRLPAGEQKLLELGPINLRPHLLYRLSYGDGIPSRPGTQTKTVINELAPGILLELGDRWHLDYTPTLRLYSSSVFRDTTDQSVIFAGGTKYQDWSLGLSQSYLSSSQPLIETASQTDQETFSTALNAAYSMSSKLSLELGLSQNFRFLGESTSTNLLGSSRDWSTMDWLNYQFWPRFGAAIGVGFGYVGVDVGPNMTYEQLQGRINWQAGDKLSVSLNGGFEDRQFLDAGAPNVINPLYGLLIQYALFEATTISVNGNRAVSASYFQNQITETTDINGSIRQRLFKKLYFDLSGGYRLTSYRASATGLAINREDNYSYFNVRLTCPFLKRGTAAIFYQASDNASSASGFTSSSEQVGLELGYRL